jgi:hypothetical protein
MSKLTRQEIDSIRQTLSDLTWAVYHFIETDSSEAQHRSNIEPFGKRLIEKTRLMTTQENLANE